MKEILFNARELNLLLKVHEICQFGERIVVYQMTLLKSLFPNGIGYSEPEMQGIITVPIASMQSFYNDIEEALTEFDFYTEKPKVNKLLERVKREF